MQKCLIQQTHSAIDHAMKTVLEQPVAGASITKGGRRAPSTVTATDGARRSRATQPQVNKRKPLMIADRNINRCATTRPVHLRVWAASADRPLDPLRRTERRASRGPTFLPEAFDTQTYATALRSNARVIMHVIIGPARIESRPSGPSRCPRFAAPALRCRFRQVLRRSPDAKLLPAHHPSGRPARRRCRPQIRSNDLSMSCHHHARPNRPYCEQSMHHARSYCSLWNKSIRVDRFERGRILERFPGRMQVCSYFFLSVAARDLQTSVKARSPGRLSLAVSFRRVSAVAFDRNPASEPHAM
jgi:hypothetical protein